MRIDSHQHFWKFDPVRDAWINDEMKVIQRNFFPEDLAPVLKANNIDGCVSVQADQSEEETQFLLNHAERNEFIKGVVGWLDLRAENFEERLAIFLKYKKLRGLRHIVQGEPVGFMRNEPFSKGISLLKGCNLTYDILIYPHQLDDALWLVARHPEQQFVIDHIAKPYIKDKRDFDGWSKRMKQLATHENVFCKLSGMVTEANWKGWKREDFNSYIGCVIDAFGTSRVMYGSDWPVCLVAASYEQQLGIIENFIHSFSFGEKQQIMGENAMRFYNL